MAAREPVSGDGGFVVTVDGPAGSGKSTVARMLADKIGAAFLDTGAMYRVFTLAAIEAGCELEDTECVLAQMQRARVEFDFALRPIGVTLNGRDVSEKIRQNEVTVNVKFLAREPAVRQRLVEMQRKLAGKYDKVVTEGRDQGTAVFPNAAAKIFLDASIEERAARRYKELKQQGQQVDIDELKEQIAARDESDRSRQVGPLKCADDAVIVDTSDMSIEKVVSKLVAIVEEKCLKRSSME